MIKERFLVIFTILFIVTFTYLDNLQAVKCAETYSNFQHNFSFFNNFQSSTPNSHSTDIVKGKVIEKIVCATNQTQSYALYLPSNYASEKKWPVIYCFDPFARGAIAVEQFRSAAEKYGYIVIGSNNSQNGPNVPINEIVKSMIEDSHTKFSIDDTRVYTAGLSGGARIASIVADASKGYIVGVIACSAGFPPNIKPSRSTPFIFFATAGIEDFNFTELNQLHRLLDEFSITNRLEIFQGGHGWAPEEVTIEAIEWLELQAMKAGKKAKNEALIDELLKKRAEKAHLYEGNILSSYSAYTSLASDFKGLRDISEFEKIQSKLKDSKELKQALKQQKEEEEKEENIANKFLSLKANLSNLETRASTIQELKTLIQNIKKKADEKENSSERMLAKRQIGFFLVNTYEESNVLIFQKNYEFAVINLELAIIIRPTNPTILHNLSSVYSLKGEKKKAIETLKKAIENGFKDIDEINTNKAFDSIREDSGFKKIVEELKSK